MIQTCVLIHVHPVTSAFGERSFSTARKSWLRAKISQKRFNHVALLNIHKTRTDNLRLVDVANEFTARNDNRKRNFSTFTMQDLLPWSVGSYRLVLISSFLVIDVVLRCSCSAIYSVSLLNKNNESSHASAKLSLVGGGKDRLGIVYDVTYCYNLRKSASLQSN